MVHVFLDPSIAAQLAAQVGKSPLLVRFKMRVIPRFKRHIQALYPLPFE